MKTAQKKFEESVNSLIKEGYKLSSSDCGYVGEVGGSVYDCEYFIAIMVKEESD